MLAPYSDTAAPVIGKPTVYSDGQAMVDAFDPQSFIERMPYKTPVLAPAALAWRLYSPDGRPVSQLEFAVRSSQHLVPDSLRSVVFAPGARNPGFECFFHRQLCLPTWRYRLAGGLTPTLPLGTLSPGRYRLAVYAWDYADNRSARDSWIRVEPKPAGPRSTPPTGGPSAAPDVQ